MPPVEIAFAEWISDAIESLGCGGAFDQTPLEAEASFRRFYRVSPHGGGSSGESYVAMYSPPEHENNTRFARLAEVFSSRGVPVPAIRVADPPRGFFLLTDLGSRSLADAYEEQDAEAALTTAIEYLVRIQAVRHPTIGLYETDRFRDELEIFREWFVAGLLRVQFPRLQLDPTFDVLIAATQDQPQCCVHRDFHCRNLLYGTDGRFGVVDFQDALVGPVSYDLASLLRDCYHRFPEPEITRWRNHYLATTPFELDEIRFAELLDLSAVQRQLKAIGIFSRLHLRDAKSSHLPVILPVLDRLIDVTENYSTLNPLHGWLRDIRPRADTVLKTLK
ncbi:MAG: phosphotransferase [Gammaproteobacteria bacterium]|nr:phosphotransferase [Gammaproteobacteria bacterium]